MFVFKNIIAYFLFFTFFPLTTYANYSDKKFNMFINNISNDAQKKGGLILVPKKTLMWPCN